MFATVITSFKAKRQYFSFDGSLAIQRELVLSFRPACRSESFQEMSCRNFRWILSASLYSADSAVVWCAENYAEQFDQLHIYLKAYLCIEVKNVYHRFYKTRARRPFLSKFALCQKL